MIRARGLERRYGSKRVLRGLDLDVERGGFVLVTGPNGSGKTTLLRLVAGLAAPTGGTLEVDVERAELGYLGHEPLVYRELSALENLRLYARLYRVADGAERIGMVLERFGLWDARNERVGTYSRGMLQRLALCRALLHEPTLLLLDEPFSGLDAAGVELLERELDERRGRSTFLVATHDRRAAAATRDGRSGAVSYFADVAALARKDLLLELRARETLPAMLLFVVATLVAFRFALPGGGSERASIGLLWVAILFTALLGLTRAFVPEREQHVLDALVLAPVDRSAIWLGKVDRHARVPRRRGGDRAAGVRALLRARSRGRPSRRSRSPTSASAPSARSSPRWPRPGARASCSSRSSSSRSRCRSSSAASAPRSTDEPARYLGLSRSLRRRFRDTCVGEL